MFKDKIKKFLKQPQFMILTTFHKNGSAHMTIVWYIYEDRKFMFSTTTDRVKYKNIKRNNNVSFVIPDKDNFYRYVQVMGAVTDISKDKDFEFIDLESKKYLGEEKYPYDPKREEERVILTITPKDHFVIGFD